MNENNKLDAYRELLKHERLLNQVQEKETVLNPASRTGRSPRTPSVATPPEPAKTKAQQLFQGQDNPKRKKKIARLEQWIEVTIRDGKTVTTRYPSNEKVIKRGQRLWPAPEYMYRRINFPNGIPAEYEWVGIIDENHRKLGGMGIQRMTIDTWLKLIDDEAKNPHGHLLPVATLPRPREAGGCDCPTCTHNQALLDAGIPLEL